MTTAREWLDRLWPHGLPGGAVLALWWASDGRYTHTSDLDEVAATVEGEPEVFLGCCALKGRPAVGRGLAADVAYMPGLWLDLDHMAPWRKAPCEMSDLEACIERAYSIDEPTHIVQTGGGVHAWWIFDEPVAVATAGAPALVRLSQGWHRLHAIGTTFDLARILRPVGSVHTRGAAPQRVDVWQDQAGFSPRYSLASLERRLPRWTPRPIELRPPVPHEPVEAPHGRQDGPLWEHRWVLEAMEHRGAAHESNRAWDMAVIRAGLRASDRLASDDALADLVRRHRERWGGAERLREKDVEQSIARARGM